MFACGAWVTCNQFFLSTKLKLYQWLVMSYKTIVGFCFKTRTYTSFFFVISYCGSHAKKIICQALSRPWVVFFSDWRHIRKGKSDFSSSVIRAVKTVFEGLWNRYYFLWKFTFSFKNSMRISKLRFWSRDWLIFTGGSNLSMLIWHEMNIFAASVSFLRSEEVDCQEMVTRVKV